MSNKSSVTYEHYERLLTAARKQSAAGLKVSIKAVAAEVDGELHYETVRRVYHEGVPSHDPPLEPIKRIIENDEFVARAQRDLEDQIDMRDKLQTVQAAVRDGNKTKNQEAKIVAKYRDSVETMVRDVHRLVEASSPMMRKLSEDIVALSMDEDEDGFRIPPERRWKALERLTKALERIGTVSEKSQALETHIVGDVSNIDKMVGSMTDQDIQDEAKAAIDALMGTAAALLEDDDSDIDVMELMDQMGEEG